jgi:carboxypeptidase T
VLFTAMIHGLELVGGVALHATIARILEQPDPPRLVVLPSVNPDGVARNLAKHRAGKNAARRSNAGGVDLNRNFDRVIDRRLYHPFSGSRLRISPHYVGPAPFSEPESRAVRDVALEVRPALSFAFHSFGNLLLHPWSHTKDPHPRTREYRALGDAFRGAQKTPYKVLQGYGFYPIAGDLDDWLDAHTDTLAFTVEVGRPSAEILHPRRLFDPFCWMSPVDPTAAVEDVVPGVVAAIVAWRG